jgi:Predicted dehydrogenases and related proteins
MNILSSKPIGGNIFRKPELNWGILGTARIAEKAVIPALLSMKHMPVIAVASRDLTRAQEFAAPFEIPRAYGNYEDLLSDSSVQAVYIPLPNSEHAPWAIKAMQAGKHVLVEKPFALTADEAQLMVSTALENSVVLMEGFMYRYSERFEKIHEIVRSGKIGKIRLIQSSFTFTLSNPDDIRLAPELGGGALYDLGCYCINIQRLLVGREPNKVQAICQMSKSDVDLQTVATLDFGDQVYGQFMVSFNADASQFLRVVGSAGTIHIEYPFNPHGEDASAWLNVTGKESKRINFRSENSYKHMVEHFYNVAVSKDVPKFPLSDAINNMVVIDALFQSAVDNGRLVNIK